MPKTASQVVEDVLRRQPCPGHQLEGDPGRRLLVLHHLRLSGDRLGGNDPIEQQPVEERIAAVVAWLVLAPAAV